MKNYSILINGKLTEYDFDEPQSDEYIVVAIAKQENDYIVEWVEHYLNLGFDRIFIGDNNEDGDESLSEILKPYIESKKVVILRCNFGKEIFQAEFYTMFSIRGDYKWAFYPDIDEFLELNYTDDIKLYLDSKKEEEVIYFKWVNYGNNGHIEKTNEPIQERFKYPLPLVCACNTMAKAMVKGTYKMEYRIHGPSSAPFLRNSINYHDGYLKHYKFKSVEEQNVISKRKLAYTFNKNRMMVTDFKNDLPYHDDLINLYNDIRHDYDMNFEDISKYGVIFYGTKTENDYGNNVTEYEISCPAVISLIQYMINNQNENKCFVANFSVSDEDFLILFEYALHTGNKVSKIKPFYKNKRKYLELSIVYPM